MDRDGVRGAHEILFPNFDLSRAGLHVNLDECLHAGIVGIFHSVLSPGRVLWVPVQKHGFGRWFTKVELEVHSLHICRGFGTVSKDAQSPTKGWVGGGGTSDVVVDGGGAV